MPSLDAMVLLMRDMSDGSLAPDDDAMLLSLNVDVIAWEAGNLRGEHEPVRCFVQVDWWSPAWGVRADELSKLFVQREQVPQRIPACEGHLRHRSMGQRPDERGHRLMC